ncbi:double-strand break repair protein, putative [Theileria annulata]|uniref:Double-strand break repair protein, putative n=1 Tax=Theileria annulata TaxID=5874 RepID=Q4U965_THEAN|nr:double-strand break repair protein, putative [Theileria annulata]CAI76638.1 double-strand break repair protein, putative [Theileria annulata]|eukprot:XP_953263.1 double-strand break repair protein, putative [Theileria annulata]
MTPKSVSFKSVWDKIVCKNDTNIDSLDVSLNHVPIVNTSPVIQESSPTLLTQKRLLIDRPLKFSSDFTVSEFDSEIKEFCADNIDELITPGALDRCNKDSNDSGVSTVVFSDKIKINQGDLRISEFSPNPLRNTERSDSINTTIVESNYGYNSVFSDLNSDHNYHTPVQKYVNKNQSTFSFNSNRSLNDKIFDGIKSDDSFFYKLIDKSEPFSSFKSPFSLENPEISVNFSQNEQNGAPMQLDSDVSKEFEFKDLDESEDDNVVKILVFTDTHLGYKEDDPFRGNDSLNTFEELLFIAKHLEVDFILHSGDLFDKNMPSRTTMYLLIINSLMNGIRYRTMDLLSTYLLSSMSKIKVDKSEVESAKLISFDKGVANNPLGDLAYSSGVSKEFLTPFFVIHGNHDNPTYQHSLSPIDILDVAGLVTYFGRVFDLENVVIKPIKISKGDVKIALYGLGWIKDERLVEMFNKNMVKFEQCEEFDKYYKILMIHQNRYPRRGINDHDYVTTNMIPEWFDLVIWGHEHESIKFPQKSSFENFQILQLGSTIQTCLVPAEIPPKHACLIHITTENVNFYPISLKSTRKFISDELPNLNTYEKPHMNAEELQNYLKKEVEKLLENSEANFTTELNSLSLSEELSLQNLSKIQSIIHKASCPLVRIKVDGSVFEVINPKLFGSSFIGKVANPNDILKMKKLEVEESSEVKSEHVRKKMKQQVLSSIGDNCQLSLLLESELNEAVNRFANGMESQIILEYVRGRVSLIQEYIKTRMRETVSDQLSEDLYSELIDKFIHDKTEEDRVLAVSKGDQTSSATKNYDTYLNYIIEEDNKESQEINGRCEVLENDKETNGKKKTNTRSSKCVKLTWYLNQNGDKK